MSRFFVFYFIAPPDVKFTAARSPSTPIVSGKLNFSLIFLLYYSVKHVKLKNVI